VNKLVYLKVVVLVLALCGVVYVITHMSPTKVAAGMEQVGLNPAPVGAPPSAPAAATAVETAGGVAGPTASVNICPTRVHAIVWPDGRKLQEASGGMKARWQSYNLTPEDVGSMDIEKWLSLHCQVSVTDHAASASMKPYVTFEYIDGKKEALDRSDDGVYRFAGKTFVSPDLDQAFADLIKVANLEPRGP